MQPSQRFVQVATNLLDREEEMELFEKWNDARQSGNTREENRLFTKIARQFSPIVSKLVRKMKGYGLDPDDLTSEALLGLSKAAIDFDPSKGFRFGTYASNCVINTLYTYVTRQYFITNVCSNAKNKRVFFGLRRHMARQMRETGKNEMTVDVAEKLAAEMEVSVDTILTMSNLLRNPYSSLNQTLTDDGDDSATHQDMLESHDPTQDDIMEGKQLKFMQMQLLKTPMDDLDDRARSIVQRSMLVDVEDKETLEDLGKDFSISKERVRQIRERATMQIKDSITRQLKEKGFSHTDIMPVI